MEHTTNQEVERIRIAMQLIKNVREMVRQDHEVRDAGVPLYLESCELILNQITEKLERMIKK